MFELMKLVGVSAVLSAGLVTASEMQPKPEAQATSGKIYVDRVPEGEAAPVARAAYAAVPRDEDRGAEMRRDGKGDALTKAPPGCASQAWPHITPECLPDGPARAGVRMITVEQRQSTNVSVLVRVPAAEVTRH